MDLDFLCTSDADWLQEIDKFIKEFDEAEAHLEETNCAPHDFDDNDSRSFHSYSGTESDTSASEGSGTPPPRNPPKRHRLGKTDHREGGGKKRAKRPPAISLKNTPIIDVYDDNMLYTKRREYSLHRPTYSENVDHVQPWERYYPELVKRGLVESVHQNLELDGMKEPKGVRYRHPDEETTKRINRKMAEQYRLNVLEYNAARAKMVLNVLQG